MKTSTNLFLRFLKLIDIGYITAIYFVVGILLGALMDKLFGTLDPQIESAKSFLQVSIECVGLMWLYGVIIYIVRNLVEQIPFPLDGVSGFKHDKVKELKNASVFVFVFLYFQQLFKDKMDVFASRVRNTGNTLPNRTNPAELLSIT